MSGYEYSFTVFTPTYNRADTLHRVLESLAQQTYRSFEWLIVDDGSTDQTEALVRCWEAEAPFPVRYLWQENQGKHVAFNRAVREARGELFLTLDSDDACVPQALERLRHHWDAIPPEERSQFSAVTALCVDQEGRLVGDRFPRDIVDSDSLEIAYRYGVSGEKWGFHRTEVLREFSFPEELKGVYVPEVLAWTRIARRYRTRFVNETLRIYYRDRPSMVTGQRPGKNAAGRRLAHLCALNEQTDYLRYAPLRFLRAAGQYARLSFHAGIGIQEQASELAGPAARLLWSLMVVPGLLLYLRDPKAG